MLIVAHHLALGVAILGLYRAGDRFASLSAPAGPERMIAAVVLAAGAAVAEALLLGLFGLGASAPVLVAAAIVTWLVAARVTPPPTSGLAQLRDWWSGLSRGWRALIGGVTGLGLGWTAWILVKAPVGVDGIGYHLMEVLDWVHNGHPGAVERVLYPFPVGNYPLTNEVLLGWTAAISRSWAPVALWAPASAVLIVVCAAVVLRTFGVNGRYIALAIAAFCAYPYFAIGLSGAGTDTDVAAVAWLLCTAALAARARDHPPLLAPAVVALGLAVGTKTTVLPLGALALILGLLACRQRLRSLVRPLAAAALLAVVVGGTWYIRNTLVHGSPLWPFVSAPWGDPVPRFFRATGASLLQHPGVTLFDRLDTYATRLAGAAVLLLGAAVVAVADRRRTVLAAAAVTAFAVISWAAAPFTGVSSVVDFTPVTIRYLLSTFLVATLTVALATTSPRVTVRRLAAGILVIAVSWSVGRVIHIGQPGWEWLFIGACVGSGLGASLRGVGALDLLVRARTSVLVVVASVLTVPLSHGFMERHARIHAVPEATVAQWLLRQPHFDTGTRSVTAVPAVYATFAGDWLRHRVELLGPGESCQSIRRRAATGWVVVNVTALTPSQQEYFPEVVRALQSTRCLAREAPVYADPLFRVYRLGRSG